MDTHTDSLDPRAFLDFEVVEWLRRSGGRETFSTGPLPSAPAGYVVKRSVGSVAKDDWHERLRGRRARSPGQREFDALVRLAEDGLPVPRAITFCEERVFGGVRRSLVVMERVVHADTVRDRLAVLEARERRALCERVLEIVVRLHARGWYHRDLYLQHFVICADGGALVLLDVGRARRERRPRSRWFVKDLAALAHSAPARVTAREKLRFAAAWLDAHGVRDREERRRWLRAIVAKRARMAARVPRDERSLAGVR